MQTKMNLELETPNVGGCVGGGEPVPIMEIFSMEGLRAYIPYCRKKPDFDEDEIIGDILNAASPSVESDRAGRLLVPYSNSSSYARRYAREPSRQRLSRLG